MYPLTTVSRHPLWTEITMDRLVISPEPFIQKCRSLPSAKSIYLDTIDGHVRLVWTNDGVVEFMERADMIGLGISYDMLLDALSEAEGAIDTNGSYPVSEAIWHRLNKLFGFHMRRPLCSLNK